MLNVFNKKIILLSFLGVLSLMPLSFVLAKNFIIHDDNDVTNTYFIVNGTNSFVGIGTSSPLTKFSVQGVTGSPIMNIAGSTGTSFFYINETGNVGIGTTAPGAKLHISGGTQDIKIDGSGTGEFWQFQTGTSNIALKDWNGNQWFQVDQANNKVIFNNGNVGIGTTEPETSLYISKTTVGGEGAVVTITNGSETSGAYTGIRFANVASTNYKKGGIFYSNPLGYGGSGRGDIIFAQNTNSDSTNASPSDAVMTIQNTGNVGIGTTAPGEKLDVVGSAKFLESNVRDQIQLQNNGITARGVGIYMKAYNNSTVFKNDSIFFNPDDEYIGIGGQTYGSESLVIKTTGNVGIGTTSPAYKLEVAGTGKFTGNILAAKSDSTEGTSAKLSVYAGSGDTAILANDVNANLKLWSDYNDNLDKEVYIQFGNGISTGSDPEESWYTGYDTGHKFQIGYKASAWGIPGDGDLVTIQSNGNVGIGTTGPGSKLSVSGGATFGSGYTANNMADGVVAISGNLGIGTTSPADKLHVTSTLRVGGTTAGGGGADGDFIKIEASSGSTSLTTYRFDQAAFRFWNPNAGEIMRITKSGNVGIGTTNPSEPLHITATEGAIQLEGTTDTFINFGTSADPNSGQIFHRDDSHMGFRVGDAERVRITSAGNVGIGTTGPSEKLQVSGSIYLTAAADTRLYTGKINLQHTNFSGTGWARGIIGNNIWWDNTNSVWDVQYGGIQSEFSMIKFGPTLKFYSSASTGAARTITDANIDNYQRMIITGAGNVGIGTAGPGSKLEVKSSAQNSSPFLIKASGSTNPIAFFYEDADSDGSLYIKDKNNNVDVFINTGGYSYFNGGNVGIGTTAPGYQLQLSTDSAAKPGSAYWSVYSDERLKDVNGDFTRGLEALKELYPSYFNYKKGNEENIPYDKEYVGLIAQDVQKVIPEAVTKGQDGFLSIKTDPILWTMLNAIKELALKVSSETLSYNRKQLVVENSDGEVQVKIAYDEDNYAELQVSAVGDLLLSAKGGDVKLQNENLQVCSGGACPRVASSLEGVGNLVVENTAFVAGALGIGTAEPSRGLDVFETETSPQMRISYDKDLYSELKVGATGDLTISAQGGDVSILNENFRVCSDDGCPSAVDTLRGAGNLVVENNLLALGKVGINTASPAYTLDVNGTLRAHGITDASDIRLKTNIKNLGELRGSTSDVTKTYSLTGNYINDSSEVRSQTTLEKIQNLRGVTFEWLDKSFGQGKQIGMIAQELEKEYPELVSTDNQGFKSIQYGKFTAVLLEAIKELFSWSTTIEYRSEELENRMVKLEKENKGLKIEMEKLEKRVKALEGVLVQ